MAAVWMDAWGLFGMERAEGSGKVSLRGPEQRLARTGFASIQRYQVVQLL